MKKKTFLTLLFFPIVQLLIVVPAFPQDINQILTKIQEANASTRYQGILTTVLINDPFNTVYRYKVENNGTRMRREELLTNGLDKEINYDDGKNLWRFFPKKNFVIKENSRINQYLSGKNKEKLDLVKNNYQIEVLEEYTAHDRTGFKVLFKPKNADRPQQIYWIDGQTGVPIKIEKYGPDNALVVVSSFAQIDFDLTSSDEDLFLKVPPETIVTEVTEEPNLTLEQVKNLMGDDLHMPSDLPFGFQLTNIIFRSSADGKDAQFFYTDGLTSLSIFQERLNGEDRGTLETPFGNVTINEKAVIFNSTGTLNILTIQSEKLTTTVIGEIFKDEIAKVAQSLTSIPVHKEEATPPMPTTVGSTNK